MENKANKVDQRSAENSSNKMNKRQIYLWPKNKEFYDSLKNKSRLINLLLEKYREENEK